MSKLHRALLAFFFLSFGSLAYADCQYNNGQWALEGTVSGNLICRAGQWVQNLPPPPGPNIPPAPPSQGCFYSNGQWAPEGTTTSDGRMICRNSQWVTIQNTPYNPLPGGRWSPQDSVDELGFDAAEYDSVSSQFSGWMTNYTANGNELRYPYSYRPTSDTTGILTITAVDGVVTLQVEVFSYSNINVRNSKGTLGWLRK